MSYQFKWAPPECQFESTRSNINVSGFFWNNHTNSCICSFRQGILSEYVLTCKYKNWKRESTSTCWTQELSAIRLEIRDTMCQEGIHRMAIARTLALDWWTAVLWTRGRKVILGRHVVRVLIDKTLTPGTVEHRIFDIHLCKHKHISQCVKVKSNWLM